MAATVSSLPVDVDSLVGASFDELAARFEDLPAPDPSNVRGLMRGRVLNVAGLESLPRFVRRPVARVVSDVTRVWVGKRFDAGSGANVWLRPGGPEFASFRGELASNSSGPVMRLDYTVEANPSPVRGIVGEARRLAPGRLLARMSYRVGSRELPLLWFTLDS